MFSTENVKLENINYKGLFSRVDDHFKCRWTHLCQKKIYSWPLLKPPTSLILK